MTITAAQIRQARTLLRWTSPRLTKAAKVSFDKVLKAQDDEAMLALSFMDVGAIRAALENAGVLFKVDDKGRPVAVLNVSKA